ncbi:conjugal transfer protein TraJ [Salmonella enterica subsp. enterica serovar Telelkebir]|nr:conjugal transfer protein TraJ [Salmonella enterica subsp. enterica serovar Telelkebir]
MNDQERGIAFLAALFLPVPFTWFLIAKFTYGINHETARYLIPYLLKNTFNLWPLWCSLIIGPIIGLCCFVGYIIHDNNRVYKGPRFKRIFRGTRLVKASSLAEKTKKRNEKQITIANVPVPVEVENLHFSIGGATGVGKTTIFNEAIYGSIKRGCDKRVIIDPNGGFVSNFYREGDIILSPYDKRSPGWSMFNEIRDDFDYDLYAVSIIQESKDRSSEEWYRYGRLLYREVSKKLLKTKRNPTMEDVLKYTSIIEAEELKAFVKGTPAEALFIKGAERATGSARFVLSDKLAPHLKMPAGDFSLRDWLEDDKPGSLFITWQEQMKKSLNPLISCWLDIIFSSLLGMGERRQNTMFFIDELETLEYLPNLQDILTKGRKSGASVWAGYQAYSQLVERYGHNVAETLLGSMRTSVVMGGSRLGKETLEHMSRAIGEIEGEIERRRFGVAPVVETRTVRAVTPTEIAQLENLTGYIAFPGGLPVGKFKTERVDYSREIPVPGIMMR